MPTERIAMRRVREMLRLSCGAGPGSRKVPATERRHSHLGALGFARLRSVRNKRWRLLA
jgi:hypothetical protein